MSFITPHAVHGSSGGGRRDLQRPRKTPRRGMIRPSILDYFARDVAPTSPVVQHLPDQLVREAQDAGDDRVGASRAVARAVGRRAAAEHQASQAEHLLARRPPISRPGAARRFNTFGERPARAPKRIGKKIVSKRDPLARRVSTFLAGLRGHSGEVRVDDAGGPLVGLTVLVFCLLVISARDQAFIGTLVHLR